jgi:hypothetical protein
VSLVWAVLDRASAGWRGLTMTPDGSNCSKIYATSCSIDALHPGDDENNEPGSGTPDPSPPSTPNLSQPPHDMTIESDPRASSFAPPLGRHPPAGRGVTSPPPALPGSATVDEPTGRAPNVFDVGWVADDGVAHRAGLADNVHQVELNAIAA